METFGLKAVFTVGLLDHTHVLLRFNHEEDYHCLWLREPCYLKRFSIRVFKWTLEFKANVES